MGFTDQVLSSGEVLKIVCWLCKVLTSVGISALLTENLHGISQSLQAKTAKVSPSHRTRFFLHSF
jgi:archaellum component FlaG (FlaF/FlaG flagellin family)